MTSRRQLHDRRLVRRIYEERPYPAEDASILRRPAWRCVPVEWLGALAQSAAGAFNPARILIAGCGTGAEAFAMQRRFPGAEIVAIDFSPRSIEIARRLQRRAPAMRSIEFTVADLSRVGLHRKLGAEFDLISCHGVLSYIPDFREALANLARCLGPRGALYLGVNGARHTSVAGRRFLEALGFDVLAFADDARLRASLKLFDAFLGQEVAVRLAKKRAGYLASDLFGPVIHNFPLRNWVSIARSAGLHFQASRWGLQVVREAAEGELARVLLPRSRAEVCELTEGARPAAFHQLVFTRHPLLDPPWKSHADLMRWRPVWTGLYRGKLPNPRGSWDAMHGVSLGSTATNTRLDWQMPGWELEILRQSRAGRRRLGEIIAQIPLRVPAGLLREQLYTLYQLVVLNLVS